MRAHRYRFADEYQLQDLLERVFDDAGFDFTREAVIDVGRIDFLIGRTGVEVKIKGSAAQVGRQLERYGRSTQLDELVLVTSRLRHVALNGLLPVTVVPVVAPF